MTAAELLLSPGPAGWVMATVEGGGSCFVRFERDADKRWHATWVLAPAASAESAPSPRRVELAVNTHEAASAALAAKMTKPIGQVGSVAFFKAFDGFGIPAEAPIQLERPAGKRLDDGWYAKVADVYRAATARGLNPRAAIAEAAGVSPDVAGRWIYEARKRKKLPKTTAGTVNV